MKGSGVEIGQLLKMCRIRSDLTQEQIAVQINATQSVVSRIEAGQIIPDIDLVMRWAEVTDSGEFIALALTGSEGWQRLIRIELMFKQLQTLISEIGA